MTTNTLLKWASGIALSTTMLSCKTEVPQQKPVNILFIMTDDHTAQMMSCYDNRFVKTPHLDRIAQNGVKFTQSFVANSISGPSRACMLTGKHSHANGFTSNEKSHFDGAQQTFPKLLQKAGYQTAVIGKWHLHTDPTGFDHWDIIPGQGDYYNPHFYNHKGDSAAVEGYLTDIITDKSIAWMEQQRQQENPFLLLMHHKAIHRNWMADTTYLNLYEDVVFPLPENFYDNYEGRVAAQQQEMSISEDMDLAYDLKLYEKGGNSPLQERYELLYNRMNEAQKAKWEKFYDPIAEEFKSMKLTGKELAEWKYQRYMRDYCKTLKSLDESVGETLDYLERNDLLKNTLVVYTSDQGFYMGEHGWFDKRFMYEQSMSTPLVMLLPEGYQRRGDVTELVQNIDYAPTFLEMAGVSIPEDIQGSSMVPLLKGTETTGKWRDAVYYHFYEYPAEHMVKRHYGVRTDRYKLIHFYNDIDTWELYDLKNDPNEMKNLYGTPETAEITATLKQKLKELEAQYNVVK